MEAIQQRAILWFAVFIKLILINIPGAFTQIGSINMLTFFIFLLLLLLLLLLFHRSGLDTCWIRAVHNSIDRFCQSHLKIAYRIFWAPSEIIRMDLSKVTKSLWHTFASCILEFKMNS